MYKVVSECNKNEVWAIGFYSKEKAQQRIDEGYYPLGAWRRLGLEVQKFKFSTMFNSSTKV